MSALAAPVLRLVPKLRLGTHVWKLRFLVG